MVQLKSSDDSYHDGNVQNMNSNISYCGNENQHIYQ